MRFYAEILFNVCAALSIRAIDQSDVSFGSFCPVYFDKRAFLCAATHAKMRADSGNSAS
jgi:hypothetical protein